MRVKYLGIQERDIGSDTAMTHIPSFIEIGSGIPKAITGGLRKHVDRMDIA
jgi:hypothetical protein